MYTHSSKSFWIPTAAGDFRLSLLELHILLRFACDRREHKNSTANIAEQCELERF